MKAYKAFLIVICIALLFAGCGNLRMAASIDDLISPVAQSGENAAVQSALDEYCNGGYSIKIPTNGNYKTSYIFRDLDKNGVDEAIAFYEPSSKIGTVCMALLKKSDDKWIVYENIESSATDVNSVDFCDLNNDSLEDIIVCRSIVSKTTGFKLDVYAQAVDENGEYTINTLSDSMTASDFICVDMDENGTYELMVFSDGASAESPQAQLYSFEGGKQRLLGSTKLDATITSFESITCGETDEGMSVYADAVRSDGSSMVTEFIYWSDYYNSIISPYYSYSTSRTTATSRNSMISCKDIDDDGVIEIPTDASLSKLPSGVEAQIWKTYGNTVLNDKCFSYSCKRDGYIIVVPEDYFDALTIEYDNDLRLFKATDEDGKLVFEIMTVVKTGYNSSDGAYAEYQKIYDDSGFVYLARVDGESEIKTDIKTLESMIKTY